MSILLRGGRSTYACRIVDVIGIATDAQRLSQERLAFKRATTSDAELGEGEIVI